jgi:hypothetical protein
VFTTPATSPWGDTWILLNLPGFAVPLTWAAMAAGLRMAPGVRLGLGGLALGFGALHASDLASVASGGLPTSEPAWFLHASWVALGVVLATRYGGTGRIGAAGLGLVAMCFALQAWIPAVVLLGSATAWQLSTRSQVAVGWLLGSMALRIHGSLWAAGWIGGFLPGWSMDGVTIATAWVLGALELLGWLGVFASLRRDASE